MSRATMIRKKRAGSTAPEDEVYKVPKNEVHLPTRNMATRRYEVLRDTADYDTIRLTCSIFSPWEGYKIEFNKTEKPVGFSVLQEHTKR